MESTLSQGHVKNHHDGESAHEAQRGKVSVVVALRLGDEFFDYDVDHRPRGKGQGVGQHGANGQDRGGPNPGRNGLDNARQLPVPEALSCRDALASKREGYGDALREILETDSNCQGDSSG